MSSNEKEFKEIMRGISAVDFEFANGEPVVAPRSGKSCAVIIGVAWKVFNKAKLNSSDVEDINDHKANLCHCGSVNFVLLKSGAIECNKCGDKISAAFWDNY